ncbi:MAG TPA: nuclear transport factor 2 family protein [Mycobacteriales bacterium]|nr:nuclear transport factor 2 family protein [Mycobacteriales bacterium]
MTDEEAIRDVVARYNLYGDRGRFDELLELFAEDATLVTDEATYVGRAAIRQLFINSAGADLQPERIRHFTSTLVIDRTAADRASVRAYFQVLTGEGLDHWGTYRDILVRAGGRWLFSRREVRVDGMTPGGWAARRLGRGHEAP